MSPRTLSASHVLGGTVYGIGMALVAAVTAWPIYASGSFLLVAAVGVLAAFAVAAATRVWQWRGWLTALVTAVLFVVLGVVCAVSIQWGAPGGVLVAVRDVLLGTVTGWKDLVTVDLPVGGYRNLLVPALVVFFPLLLACILLAWRRGRIGAAGVVPALVMVCFGLVFGSASTSSPLPVGDGQVFAPRELVCGAAGLVLSLAWLAWRSQDERRAALRRAAEASGVRVSRHASASDLRRTALAAGMVAVAVVGAGFAAPALADGRSREVLRSAAGPEVVIRHALSPLTAYRASFADDAYEAVMFRVEPLDGALPARIRIATLSVYDGATFRVDGSSTGPADARFLRVPSWRDAAAGVPLRARIEIEGLRGIWLPTFGDLEELRFAGAREGDLADGFYYNAHARAAVETAPGGVAAGDSYVLTAAVVDEPALAAIESPGAGTDAAIPKSVTDWVQAQDAGTGGAALATLVERLRARGYLSHALDVPDTGAAWTRALPGYSFQPSASGHSLARIDTLFGQLLDREHDVAGEAEASLVAAIGDDEQFAVATALIAQQLGFPARIVVGARLTDAGTGVPACDDGVCTGANMTAWVEVQSSRGEWVTVDATPQFEEGVETDVTRQRDPQNPTEVRPEAAREVLPPDPEQQDTTTSNDAPAGPLDLAVLWGVLRVGGIVGGVLALAAGPFLLIVAAKASRRRRRRRSDEPALAVVGGWDEYVDAAVDHGLPAPRAHTRSELASVYATPDASALAVAADRAVFADVEPSPEESEAVWRLVDDERRRFAEGTTVWRKVLAAVSLDSFTRNLSPRFVRGIPAPRTPRRTERRGLPSDRRAPSP